MGKFITSISGGSFNCLYHRSMIYRPQIEDGVLELVESYAQKNPGDYPANYFPFEVNIEFITSTGETRDFCVPDELLQTIVSGINSMLAQADTLKKIVANPHQINFFSDGTGFRCSASVKTAYENELNLISEDFDTIYNYDYCELEDVEFEAGASIELCQQGGKLSVEIPPILVPSVVYLIFERLKEFRVDNSRYNKALS